MKKRNKTNVNIWANCVRPKHTININANDVGAHDCTQKQSNKPTSHITLPTSNNAITLIALIITIIVMLILVAVTVTMAINGGLFDRARKAREDTEDAKSAELSIADGSIIDYYVSGGDTENIETVIIEKKGLTDEELQVGDYVDYTPDAGEYPVTGDVFGENSYEGPFPNATNLFVTEDLNWRVLSKSNKTMELVPDRVLSNTVGSGIDRLNEICRACYSNSKLNAVARSINVDDINRLTGFNPETYPGYGEERTIYPYGLQSGKTETITSYNYNIPKDIEQAEMLILNKDYWLASESILENDKSYNHFFYNIRYVNAQGKVDEKCTKIFPGHSIDASLYVLPIVSINIQ